MATTPPADAADPTGGALTDTAPGLGAADADADDGYEIHLCVYGDGTYGVRGPMPLDHEAAGGAMPSAKGSGPGGAGPGAEPADTGEQTFDGAAAALKAVLKILQDNPVSSSEQEGFEAGLGVGVGVGGPKKPSGAANY